MKNHFTINYLCWLRSRCTIQNRRQFFSDISSARPSHSWSRPSVLLKSLKQDSGHMYTNSGGHHCGNAHRCFIASSSKGTFIPGPDVESEVQSVSNICSDQLRLKERNKFSHKFVFKIVDIIRKDEDEVESRLNMLVSKLSIYSVTEIFEALNSQRISGLRFAEWIWNTNHQLRRSELFCSLIIDNVGRLGDYETMFVWLKKFTSEKICLSYKAFRFLAVLSSTNSSVRESMRTVVDILNRAGGSSRNSGVFALIEMFCKLDWFEMAMYAIKITESKESYYCLLIREKCKRGLIEDAYGIIREMREVHGATSRRVCNYLLGSLLKNDRINEASALIKEMKEIGIYPDVITYEILINSLCKLGKMDNVPHLLNQMKSQGLEPRPTTHARFVKALFAAEKYEAAHNYVADLTIISKKTSGNLMYSLMAKLYWEKGDIMSARDTLVEMMEKNLKPEFSIYIKVVREFRRTGRKLLAEDLEIMQSKFVI